MSSLQGEKRVYQLELMNREKNYNQVFNAHPFVGVLNPLSSTSKVSSSETVRHTLLRNVTQCYTLQKKNALDAGNRYPSAPSLITPSPEPQPHPPSTLPSMPGSLVPLHPSITSRASITDSSPPLFPRADQQPPPLPHTKQRKLVMLRSSPSNQRLSSKKEKSALIEDTLVPPPESILQT